MAIDDEEHGRQIHESGSHKISENIKNEPKENTMPWSVIKLENLFDFQDRFKKLTTCKTHSSSMKFEVINLGTKSNLQNINLGSCSTLVEREAYIKLFREFKDVFTWTYDHLKTFDTRIMQHSIPLKENVRPYQ